MSDTIRVLSVYRGLPIETLTSAWFTENAATLSEKQLRPGEFGIAAVDEFGIQYTRPVENIAGYPSPISPWPLVTVSNTNPVIIPNNVRLVSEPVHWSQTAVGAGNAAVSTTRAGVVGQRHVATGLFASIFTPVPAAPVTLQLFNGSGMVWEEAFVGTTSPAGTYAIGYTGLRIAAVAGANLTLITSASAGGLSQQRVSLTGYTVPS